MSRPAGPGSGRAAPSRILFVFLDGVGIGVADPAVNPFLAAGERIPTLTALMGGRVPTLDDPSASGPMGSSFPLDATLDMDGTPQSGTGQTALLTGESAAEIFGGHFGPWAPVALRPLVEERNVLRTARDRGLRVAFANAYPRGWPGPRGERRVAAVPLAARGAGVLDRHEEALAEGRAVASELVNDGWREHLGHTGLPHVTPEQAGANLARVSREGDLTLFAHYATDSAGHRQELEAGIAALVKVDAFLRGVLGDLDVETLLIVASDHGNIEDSSAGHTRNPALGIAAGPAADRAERLSDIRQVPSLILEVLGAG
jgi:2,3-bisphosphoglycerate-independent phosphoglycerate mutase